MALPAVLWLFFFFLLPLEIVLVVSFMTRGLGGTITLPLTLDHYQTHLRTGLLPRIHQVDLDRGTDDHRLPAGGLSAGVLRQHAQEQASADFRLVSGHLAFLDELSRPHLRLARPLGHRRHDQRHADEPPPDHRAAATAQHPFRRLVGLVYGFLPFMVLPIYSSVERFDFRLVEAAHDLGANDWRAFWRVSFR